MGRLFKTVSFSKKHNTILIGFHTDLRNDDSFSYKDSRIKWLK